MKYPRKRQETRFYEDVGWKDSKTTDGEAHFEDAELFEDLRSVSADYIHRCHLRVRDHLPASGDLLVDAGSGPVQFPEYLTYQEGFRKRLCVDISLNALRQGRARLGERGIYVQGELTRLPIADQSIDAAVSLHTIYHVDADLQEQAILELHRVIGLVHQLVGVAFGRTRFGEMGDDRGAAR